MPCVSGKSPNCFGFHRFVAIFELDRRVETRLTCVINAMANLRAGWRGIAISVINEMTSRGRGGHSETLHLHRM
jgi:hypothetical protein